MITELQTGKRERLIEELHDRIGEIEFVYGEPIAEGDADLMLLMRIAHDRNGEPFYGATICSSPMPGDEAADLPWELVDERGDTLARGRTERRGRFRFPVDKRLVEQKVVCRLNVARPRWAAQLPLPDSVWRRDARATEYTGKGSTLGPNDNKSDRGALQLVNNQLWLTDDASQYPFAVACIAAIRQGELVGARLLPMPRIESAPQQRQNWLDVRKLVGSESLDLFEFDAWPVTEDRQTWLRIQSSDIEDLLNDPLVVDLAEVLEGLQALLNASKRGE